LIALVPCPGERNDIIFSLQGKNFIDMGRGKNIKEKVFL